MKPSITSLLVAILSTVVLIDPAPAQTTTPPPANTRLFKNRDGKKIEAELLAKSDNHARIRTTDGREFSIELVTLSDEDQQYIREWVDPKSKEAVARTDIAEVMKARGFTGIPFENRQNHLFIEVEIEGKELTFLLDSGAMTSIITPAAAKSLELEISPSQAQVAGIGGGAAVEGQTSAESCRFGGDGPVSMDFVVMDLPTHADGLIGSDFFRTKNAMLDYAGETLWLKLAK